MYSQLHGQIGQYEEEIKDKDGTIETLTRQMIQLGIKDKVRQAEHDMRKQVLDSKARVKSDVAVNKAQLDATAKEAKLAAKEHKVNLKSFENVKKKVAKDKEQE